jgi:Fe2+ or Zn2+ uptake regulation protein
MNLYIATTGRTKITALPSDIRILLNSIGLRSTSRRIALASLLLKATRRRVTAEILYKEACDARCSVSMATVCNALRQFERARLLRTNYDSPIKEGLVCHCECECPTSV